MLSVSHTQWDTTFYAFVYCKLCYVIYCVVYVLLFVLHRVHCILAKSAISTIILTLFKHKQS